MKTVPFLVFAFFSLSAQAEPPAPPQQSVAPAATATTPEATASPAVQPSPGATPSVKGSAEPTAPASKFDSGLLGGNNPVLTEEERAGVAITQAWRDKSYETLVGQPGSNSSVQFRFGQSLPSIVCAILQVTDIELQPGEAVTHINLGDSTRWSVESALSGSGADQVEHLIIKPRDIGLSTSLVVTTDRRTYHLLLRSDEAEFMHDVTFLYDGDSPSRATPPPIASTKPTPSPAPVSADPPVHSARADGKQVRLVSRVAADDADESYTVTGQADWKPVEVYNKNGKTYLEMPAEVKHKEAPVLFEEKRAGWFHHQKVLVNYRVHGRWYVVDRVLDNATLVSGVGAAQEKVDIRHIAKPQAKEALQ